MSSELFAVLEEMNNGRTLATLERQFEELRVAVVDTEGKGELVIKLKVFSGKKNLNKVVCESTAKLPQDAPEVAVFYFDGAKRLVRDDPQQTEMFARKPKVVPIKRDEVPQAGDAHNA